MKILSSNKYDAEVCREIVFDQVERLLEELLGEGVEGDHRYAFIRLETVEQSSHQF